jgi:hypothetical protein
MQVTMTVNGDEVTREIEPACCWCTSSATSSG